MTAPDDTTARFVVQAVGRDWRIELVREGDQWTATCLDPPAAGVASCGEYIGEALMNAVDAIEVYLRTVQEGER